MIKDHWSKGFSLQPIYVNDPPPLSRTLNPFRAADVGLGNRRPNVRGGAYKECTLCLKGGAVFRLNEVHVPLVCLAVGYTRVILVRLP